jgi:hypothetical protein
LAEVLAGKKRLGANPDTGEIDNADRQEMGETLLTHHRKDARPCFDKVLTPEVGTTFRSNLKARSELNPLEYHRAERAVLALVAMAIRVDEDVCLTNIQTSFIEVKPENVEKRKKERERKKRKAEKSYPADPKKILSAVVNDLVSATRVLRIKKGD